MCKTKYVTDVSWTNKEIAHLHCLAKRVLRHDSSCPRCSVKGKTNVSAVSSRSNTVSSSYLHEKTHNQIGCICLAFLHCAFVWLFSAVYLRHDSSSPQCIVKGKTNASAVSSRSDTVTSSYLHERMHNNIGCTFVHLRHAHDYCFTQCTVKGKTNVSAASSRSNTAPYARPQSSRSQHLDAHCIAHISNQFKRSFCPEIRWWWDHSAAVLYSRTRTIICLNIGEIAKGHIVCWPDVWMQTS